MQTIKEPFDPLEDNRTWEHIDTIYKLQDEYFEKQRFLNEVKRRYYLHDMRDIHKRIAEFKRDMGHKDKDDQITPLMIDQARRYPLDVLVDARGQEIVLCRFHEDKNPSMDIRNNFFYCYACGAKGDTIDFLMREGGLSFKEAVLRLQ